MTAAPTHPALGLRANVAQFSLLVAVNALVGAMLGQERTVVPLLATEEFHLEAHTAALSFILVFGLAKALTNYLAGTWSDRSGRKPALVTGWLLALPVAPLLMWAPGWEWVLVANVFLGVSQGLTWSTTVVMKIDLVGPSQRGLAMGLNEATGYAALAVTALTTGHLAEAHGLRPVPFFLGVLVAALGLGLSTMAVRETRPPPTSAAGPAGVGAPGTFTTRQVVALTSLRDPSLSAASQAGLVNNLNDGLAWGLFPVLFASAGLSVGRIGVLAAVYPAVWGVAQVGTGALSDRLGRRWLVATGMWLQAVALALIALADDYSWWLLASTLLGLGTAMVYPTLLAVISDVAQPSWRARAVGTYRLWRDLGFVAGAVVAGTVADLLGLRAAVWVVAGLTAASGLVVVVRMAETRPQRPAGTLPSASS